MPLPKNKTIAIVDDDRFLRESLQDLFETAGLIGEPYPSAEDFISRKGFLTADVVLADFHLGGMSGIELLKILRQEGHCHSVVIMTVDASLPVQAAAIQAGAVAFLLKPFSSNQLLSCVERL